MADINHPVQGANTGTWGTDLNNWLKENVFTATGWLKDPVYVSEYISHKDDSDTYFRFQTNQVDLCAGAEIATWSTSGLSVRTGNEQYALFGRSVGLLYPVPYFAPTTTDRVIALDVFPKGSPADNSAYTGVAWLDICSTDILADGTNYECLRLGKLASGIAHVGTAKGGTGTVRDLMLQIAGGNVGIGTSSSPISEIITGRTYLSIVGTTNSGVLEFVSNGGDTNGCLEGVIQFTDQYSVLATKVVAMMGGFARGTTATKRGGEIFFMTHDDNVGVLSTRVLITRTGNLVVGKALGTLGNESIESAGTIRSDVAFNVNGSVGISGTIVTYKLTGGGSNGSMTFVGGILTAQTPAT